MKKNEAFDYIRLRKGYVPYIGIFEIYEDNDEIPQELIDLSIKDDIPNENFIICSPELAKELEEIFKNL